MEKPKIKTSEPSPKRCMSKVLARALNTLPQRSPKTQRQDLNFSVLSVAEEVIYYLHSVVKAGAAGLGIFLLAACASSTGGVYHDPKMDIGSIYSVGVMPFVNLSKDQQASERVRDVFMSLMLADGRIYAVPSGEVARQISQAGIPNASAPTNDEIIKLGRMLKAQAVITGVVREYGEIRTGSASANLISLSVQMTEVDTGKVISSVSCTKGGIGVLERLFGGGGEPMNDVTEKAVRDAISKLLE